MVQGPADAPAYLTDSRLAHAERDRWEEEFRVELHQWAVHASTGQSLETYALVAASFPFWNRTMRQVVDTVKRVPRSMLDYLLHAEPKEDETIHEVVSHLAATLATAAFNVHMLEQLTVHGYTHKAWTTQHDKKVRPAHAAADGQIRALFEPFHVGGALMHYPADSRTAPIELWANDRCIVVGVP